MTLTPAQSWLLLASLTVGVVGLLWIASRPSWTHRRDAGEIRFATDPQAQMIVRRMIELADDFIDKASLSDGYNEEQRIFYGGKAATWMMGCW